MKTRLEQEILQGSKISEKADLVWGWGTPAGIYRVLRRCEHFVNLGQLRKGLKVLELGCGTGIFTEKIVLTEAQITAIDISKDLLLEATKKLFLTSKNLNLNVNFCVCDVENVSFPGNRFDCVIGSSILHHLDLCKGLKEVKRVLKEGGKFVFTEPNMMNPQILIQKNVKFVKKLLGDTPEETAYFRWRLRKCLMDIGFRRFCIKPFDFLHPMIPSCFISTIQKLGVMLENTPFVREFAGSLLIWGEK